MAKYHAEYTRDEMRKAMRHTASRQRDIADEMAKMLGGCDDPMHPYSLFDKDGDQRFVSWVDFVEKVCEPLIEGLDKNDEVAVQKAMALYRTESPFYICVSLLMARSRIKELEHISEGNEI